jgi:hypothetical protein
MPLEAVELLNVGLRSHFVASYYAAPDREHRPLWRRVPFSQNNSYILVVFKAQESWGHPTHA